MAYYEILIASASYHGAESLTYSSLNIVKPGTVVAVPLRQKQVLGIVRQKVTKPAFPVKELLNTYALPALSTNTLKLIQWVQDYYPAPKGIVVQQFLPKSLSEKLISSHIVSSVEPHNTATLPPLTHEQRHTLSSITQPASYLLHGETASGKTRVYIELTLRATAQGSSALILTPEISLTSQLVLNFREVFGDRVILIHSELTEAQRRSAWLTILKSPDPLVIIGTRSALFSPAHNLGLIVIDEAHETAYKQEQAPHYHALRVASKLGELHQATVIMGSATPSVQDYYIAQKKHTPILRMRNVARKDISSHKNHTIVEDLRNRDLFNRSRYLSDNLIEAIGKALENKKQTLLFLNRRGTARLIICEHCGWQALCPHCDIPLTYHGDSHTLHCHTCNYQSSIPASCPACAQSDILYKSIGTKAIVNEVQKLFPNARIQRFDTDNKKAESLAEQYTSVKAGKVDILVGTQTIAKGLDLPNLSVVGVLVADTSLYMPDYTAGERTYQLLTQVIGRIGRGHTTGTAIIQTYQPDNPIIKAASTRDWDTFYEAEIQERHNFTFPPFCFLLKLTCRRSRAAHAQQAVDNFATHLRQQDLRIEINGPAPAFHEKVQGKYQWQIIIKSKQRQELLKIIRQLPSGWNYDIDPVDLL